VAGHETTTSALCHLIYCLALNPDKQSKLFREIDLNWNKNLLSFENADQIKYLDACIKESLRLIPTGVRIERRATNDCKLGNVFVPKNCLVTIPVFSVHRDPENFENPDDYIPERFLDPNQIKARTYLPFADGPRNCIGMRFAQILMKITTAKLLQKFSFVQCKQTKVNDKHLNLNQQKIIHFYYVCHRIWDTLMVFL
jgi:cytochrome P450 family 3 subfamily A